MNYAALFGEVQSAVTAVPARDRVDLSSEQRAALAAPVDKSAVVCAGAGAGKTKLLAERVCALIKAGANPKRVAVVTFTRKAAQEVSNRVLLRIGDKRKLPPSSTVHSLALTTLMRRGQTFSLATIGQELACLERLEEYLPEDLGDFTPQEVLLLVNRTREESVYSGLEGLLARAYEEQLVAAGVDDFTTLLTRAASEPADLFDHIVVDEAQDLSRLQLAFLRAVGPSAKYWFIGDPDQAIYSFRGAQASMMHRLRDETELLFTLETNYRSAQSIVAHANNVIAVNPDRFPLVWRPARREAGSVVVEFHEHGGLELEHCARWLAQAPSRRCVLARTQALVAPLKNKGLAAMTVHEAKGLEWPEVMVIGCENALFPHPLAAREEERRLFYVAMTRARDSLVLSCSSSRAAAGSKSKKRRNPSVFLYETQALQAKT